VAIGAGALGQAVAALGRRLETGLAPKSDRRLRRSMVAALVLLLIAGNFWGWWLYVWPFYSFGDGYKDAWFSSAIHNHYACRNIYELHERTGRWIEANLPDDAPLAIQDAGAIRYFARGNKIIDLDGLNNHRFLWANDKRAFLRHEGVQYAVVFPMLTYDPLFGIPTRTIHKFTSWPNVIAVGMQIHVREVIPR
jgi:hypothetical protein